MSRRRAIWASIWLLSLLVAAQWGAAGQSRLPEPLTGSDFGFQVTGEQDGAPVGFLVVRVDGKWRSVDVARRVDPNADTPYLVPLR